MVNSEALNSPNLHISRFKLHLDTKQNTILREEMIDVFKTNSNI